MGVPRFLILWSLPRTQVTVDFPCANVLVVASCLS